MSASRTVAVIGGGRSPEYDVALRGAAAVGSALEAGGHRAVVLTVARDGIWHDAAGALGPTPAASVAVALGVLAACDAAFPVLHGAHGEDGTLAALLDLAGVPAVGCGTRAGAIAMDKQATKALAAALGIRAAQGVLVLPGDPVPAVEALEFALPVVVKPTAAGSSAGVAVVAAAAELAGAVAAARSVGDADDAQAVLVEEYVRGREVQVGVVERRDGTLLITPPIEYAVGEQEVFDTSRKYDGSAVVHFPARITEARLAELRAAALRLFRALGCSGLSRFDFFVTENGLLLNEVNTMPGMTATSGFPRMCAATGLDHPALVAELVEVAIARAER